MTDYIPDPLPTIDVEEFRKVVRSRRSVRRFTDEPIPEAVIQDCLDLALLSPNSSNLQPWEFHRVLDPRKRDKLVDACLGQNAARTAAELFVVVARTRTWKKHCAENVESWPEPTVPRIVENYYRKGAKVHYGYLPLDPFGLVKKTIRRLSGLARPMPRWPNTPQDMELWATKTTALAAQTMALALRAHGFDSCMMEGFDEVRLRKAVRLPTDGVVVMVLAAGRRADKGIYHARIRFPRERFLIEH
ncbi:MAG: nitroreductase family protein [Oceanococcaceae bacterium]